MIRLINIVRKNDTVMCNIIPEDCKEQGTLTVDLKKEDIQSCKLPEGYEDCRVHVRHACTAIVKDVKNGKLPKERLVMWY